MTESPFPFGAVEEAPALVEETESGSRRNLLALGGLAAVVLAGGAFFLLGGGEEEETFEVAASPRTPRAAATAAPTAVPVKLPVATKVALGRNPFRALYVQPAAGPADGGTTTPVTTPTTTPVTGTPIVVVGPGTAPAPAPAPTSTGSAAPAPTQAPSRSFSTVGLTGVSTKSGKPVATFLYDGDELTGSVGDVMGGKLKLISLQQDATGKWFANLQLGDGSPFEVFQGQTVVVQ